jgi:hypothetical protein
MTYTIAEVLSIDDSIFDALFDASYSKMEEGQTMPWEHHGSPASTEEKKAALKNIFTSSCGWLNSKVIVWHKGDTPIRMMAVTIPINDPTYLTLNYALYGLDENLSRSWLYDEEFLMETKEYFAGTFGVIGHIGCVIKDAPICIYFRNIHVPSAVYADITEETSENGLISIFKFTYAAVEA